MRPIVAFAIAPLPVSALLPMLGVRLINDGRFLAAVAFFYVVTLLSQLLVGVPTRLLLARWHVHSLRSDVLIGAFASLLPILLYQLSRGQYAGPIVFHVAVGGAAAIGACTGLAFGLLRWRDRRLSERETPAELAARFD
jgi:hypothetical protein